jgi:hypothetical protein
MPLLYVSLQLLVKDKKIVKATTPIPFGSSEDNHMNAKPATDFTGTLGPRSIL